MPAHKKKGEHQTGSAALFTAVDPVLHEIAYDVRNFLSAYQATGKERSAREDEYASDDGFVANGSDDERPRKKAKTAIKRAPPKTVGNKVTTLLRDVENNDA